jgi:disease resistance protein RPM1
MYSRQLFHRRLFKPEEDFPSHLKDVSDKILKKCDGLPLAIIAISGLLANSENTKDEWDQVNISIGSALERNRTVEVMMKITSLSYFDLPPHLKTCLLFLSIFPEDAIIAKKDLIRIWIAEGFIQKEGRYTLYEVGEKCFNELVNRSLIQPEKTNFGVVNSCRVHDTILDFLVSKSIEENFVTFVSASNTTIRTECKVRRLSIQVDKQGNSFVPKDLVLWHVRSLCVFGKSGEIPSMDRFKHLCVLDFGDCGQLKNHHLQDIGRLLQLRYLNLRERQISELPQQIGDLWCLEMLDLRYTKVFELPASIVNLKKLVHLFVDSEVKFPDGIAKLQALQKYINVHISQQSTKFLQELGELKNLKKLRLDFQGVSDTRGVSAIMPCLQNLRSLDIAYGGNFLMEENLPLLALQRLDAWGSILTRVLNSVGSLVNLQSLALWLDRVKEEDLCILGGLPILIKLRLVIPEFEDSYKSRVIVSAAHGFSCLRMFFYNTEDNEMDLMFAAGSMPKLEEFETLFDALKTESFSGSVFGIGIENLTSLTTIICTVVPMWTPRQKQNSMGTENVEAIKAAIKSVKAAIEREVRTHPNHRRVSFPFF